MEVELDYFKIVAFDSEYFFGRTCGFQVRENSFTENEHTLSAFLYLKFTQSMQTMLTFILAGLATYYETYNRSIPFAAASLATAPKYLLFPEQRAKKVNHFFLLKTPFKIFLQVCCCLS